MIEFYSSSFSLKRAVCFIIRVVKRILNPKTSIVKGRVTTDELFQAEGLIVSIIQKKSFPELIKRLKDCGTVEEAESSSRSLG